jgi:uncharacterized membrane protein YjgN (DUF898 family)
MMIAIAVASVIWANGVRKRYFRATSFRYRGESRTQTNQRRADERKNIKVAVITAVLTLIGGLALAALVVLLNLDDDPPPAPTISQTP